MELAGKPFSVMLLRRKNVWYSVRDGNWNDPNTWISNAVDRKNVTSPRPGDDVYINHTVTCDVSITINNCYVSGTLNFDANARVLTINGDLQATGTVDQSAGANTIILSGFNNNVVNYNSGSSSTFEYLNLYTQPIMPLSYNNLYLASTSTVKSSEKYLSANLSVVGTLTLVNVNLNSKGFNISVTGTTTASSSSTITSSATILFVGSVNAGLGQTLTITGTASIEMRGGLSTPSGQITALNSVVNFTTNNQSLTGNFGVQFSSITITGAITVTNSITNGGGNGLSVSTINGTVSGSTFVNLGYLTLPSFATQMATGVFNYINSGSTIAYVFNGTGTLPFTTYSNLTLSGTGVKSAGGNLVTDALVLSTSSANLEMSTFNLTVNGTTTLTGFISKSGSGSLLFVGLLTVGGGSSAFSLPGNPTIEFRGGATLGTVSTGLGTGAISFTTNSQNIAVASGGFPTIGNNITIASGITLTRSSDTNPLTITGVLTGASSTSIFINNGTTNYQNATAPMVTGKLYANQATNTWIYGASGNQDITVPVDPSSPGYKNLTLNGSGAKRLLGNVSVKGTYTLTGPATLDSNGFSLTNP